MTTVESDALIQRIAVLQPSECDAVREQIHQLREHWVLRDGVALYSLGAAMYLDAPAAETVAQFHLQAPEKSAYAEHVAKYNPLLTERFGSLYRKLESALSAALGDEVRCGDEHGLPGFHVYQHGTLYNRQISHIPHYDRQYECVDWSAHPDIDFREAISITLAIRLPAGGGGLRVWDVDLFQVRERQLDEAKKLVRGARWKIHEYALGELVCHRGHLLHQIAPWVSKPGDERITLQAHGLYFDGRWNLYW